MQTITDVENDIIADIKGFADNFQRMEFLIGLAKEYLGIPEKERDGAMLVEDCQMNTWLDIQVRDGLLSFRGDSDAFIVKGVLALLAEIYDERTCEEILMHKEKLLECRELSEILNADQRRGIASILNRIINIWMM